MVLCLVTSSDETIDRLLEFPPLVRKVIAPDDPEAMTEALKGDAKGGFLSRIFGQKSAPKALPELPNEEHSTIDLDKAWHGIHFLLTQTAWEGDPPLNFLLQGGTQIGDVDVGLGPARALRSADIAAVNEALKPIDEAFLRSKFDPTRMMKLQIYPEIWDRDPEDDDTLGYCLDNFKELKHFVSEAAARRSGLLIYMS